MKTILAFLPRIFIYPFFAWLALFIVLPRVSPEILGMLLAMPLASMAIFLDIFLTAKIKNRGVEEVIAKRIIIVDNLLAPKGERISDKRHLEVRDVQALPESSDHDLKNSHLDR